MHGCRESVLEMMAYFLVGNHQLFGVLPQSFLDSASRMSLGQRLGRMFTVEEAERVGLRDIVSAQTDFSQLEEIQEAGV